MDSSFLFLFPAELLFRTCGSGRGEEPGGGKILRLIQIRLTTPSFEKITPTCQAKKRHGNFMAKLALRRAALLASDPAQRPRFKET